MRKLVLTFLLAIGSGFIFSGCQSGLFSTDYLPIDYTESDKNSRQIWMEFKSTSKLKGSKYILHDNSDCSLLQENSRRPSISSFPETYTVMRSGSIVYSVNVNGPERYEFLGLQVDPSSALVTYSGPHGLKFGKKINIELHQDVRLVAIVYSTKISKKLNVCRIRLDQDIQRNVGGRVEYELAHKNAVKSLKP